MITAKLFMVVDMNSKKTSYADQVKKEKNLSSKPTVPYGAIVIAQGVVSPATGSWRLNAPKVGSSCIGCGACVAKCPEASIQISRIEKSRRAQIDYFFCKGCGICAAVCPKKAINMR